MRPIRAALALCLALAFVSSAQALARARHHRHALPRVAPLPPERPDIESLFTVVRRGRPVGPDGLADRAAK